MGEKRKRADEQIRQKDDAKRVNLTFGDFVTSDRVYPFGHNKESDEPVQGPKQEQQPGLPITFGDAPVNTITRTIWKVKTKYITKLPVIKFQGESDSHFQTRKEYDLEEFHEADMIRVRLPTTEPEDYDPPIYDSDDELRPKECKYHWATCDNDKCLVHKDQKQINNYRPKQVRFITPKPANDHPEVDEHEAQRCQE